MSKQYPHDPDYAVPPGETLLETMMYLGMDQRVLGVEAALPEKLVGEIISGHAPITHEIAIKLGRATAMPADFWDTLEANYRKRLAEETRPDTEAYP